MGLQEFCNYLRGGEPPAGYDVRGLEIYKRLTVGNISGMVSATIPGLRDKLTQEEWDELIQAFIADSTFTNPVIVDIREDFRNFIKEQLNG